MIHIKSRGAGIWGQASRSPEPPAFSVLPSISGRIRYLYHTLPCGCIFLFCTCVSSSFILFKRDLGLRCYSYVVKEWSIHPYISVVLWATNKQWENYWAWGGGEPALGDECGRCLRLCVHSPGCTEKPASATYSSPDTWLLHPSGWAENFKSFEHHLGQNKTGEMSLSLRSSVIPRC